MREPNLKQEWRDKYNKFSDKCLVSAAEYNMYLDDADNAKDEIFDFFYNLHQEELKKIENRIEGLTTTLKLYSDSGTHECINTPTFVVKKDVLKALIEEE